MSFSTLPLSYCTNVHPGRTLSEVLHGLASFTAPVRKQTGFPIAAGLWLAAPVIRQLTSQPALVDELRSALESHQLTCYTLNAFPYGDFHSDSVKYQVYVPDWTDPRRTEYTRDCAHILARIMPGGVEGSLSTVPLGVKHHFPHPPDFRERCIEQLLITARHLSEVFDETGRCLRLAIEPEPLCILETTAEAIEFFGQLFSAAKSQDIEDLARRHLGLCFDVCHHAVEFEDVRQSIRQIDAAGIRINKVHITCALELASPADSEARSQLANFAEPRYLHQTFARTSEGRVIRFADLSRDFANSPPPEFASATAWRIHFHVPVNNESLGKLRTTRPDLVQALAEVKQLVYAPHLEVETYTWGVLPGQSPNLIAGLTSELTATKQLLDKPA